MIVESGSNKIDLDRIESYDDIIKALDELKPQSTIAVPTPKSGDLSRFVKFDELTTKEIAESNIVFALQDAYNKVADEIFPMTTVRLVTIAALQGQVDSVKLPNVDPESYSDYQKLSYFMMVAKARMNCRLQSRVGFGTSLFIHADGTVYALQDLKELFKPGLYQL